MKKLLLLSCLFSFNTFAYQGELNALDAFRAILNPGEYQGSDCSVQIDDHGGSRTVIIFKGEESLQIKVNSLYYYKWQPGQRFFITGNKAEGDFYFDELIEVTFFTRMISRDKQYFSVEKREVTSSRHPLKRFIECEASF